MPNNDKRLIIIGGMPRSGTSLVRSITDSHSEIALLQQELNCFQQLQLGAGIATVLTSEKARSSAVDVSSLISLPPAMAYRSLLFQFAEQQGKRIGGEKSPMNEFYYHKIREWTQGTSVKFIHMVRNPWNMIASCKYAPFRGPAKGRLNRFMLKDLAMNWRRSVELGLARVHRQSDSYALVQYEELVADPAREVARLCEFLGVGFEQDEMLSASRSSAKRNNTSFESVEPCQSTGTVYQPPERTHCLTQAEQRTVSAVCGELAREMGYGGQHEISTPPADHWRSVPSRVRQAIRQSVRKLSAVPLMLAGKGVPMGRQVPEPRTRPHKSPARF